MDRASTYTVDTGVSGGLDTQHAAGLLVLSALAFLILVRRGFRGIKLG